MEKSPHDLSSYYEACSISSNIHMSRLGLCSQFSYNNLSIHGNICINRYLVFIPLLFLYFYFHKCFIMKLKVATD